MYSLILLLSLFLFVTYILFPTKDSLIVKKKQQLKNLIESFHSVTTLG